MKAILIYYFYEELLIDATTSVTRLVATITEGLQLDYDMYYLSFAYTPGAYPKKANRVHVKIPLWRKALRRLNNLMGIKRIHWRMVQRSAVKATLSRFNKHIDAVIVLGLDDVGDARKFFPDAKIIYWIHNISALCKPQYLRLINEADYFVTPSRNAYHLLMQKIQPSPLTAEYYFMPNWCNEVFLHDYSEEMIALREHYAIPESAFVFIFTGGNHPVKGKNMINKLIKNISGKSEKKIYLIIAGEDQPFSLVEYENITVLHVGLLPVHMLAVHYRIANFGLFPSMGYDHTPLTLIEMAFAGVIPIASDIGGVNEILGADYPFLVREPHHSGHWVEAVNKALDMENTDRETIVASLRKKVGEKYTFENALSVMHRIIG